MKRKTETPTMVEVDNLSLMLGELKADAASAKKQRSDIFEMLGEVQKAVALMPALIATVNESREKLAHVSDAVLTIPALTGRVDEHEKHIDDYVALKNRGLGIIAFVGLIGGGFAVGIGKVAEWMK